MNNYKIINWLYKWNFFNTKYFMLCFLYYIIRVFRDVILVILKCTDFIKKSIIIHLIEIISVIFLMNYFIPKYQIKGLFLSFSIATAFGLLFFIKNFRKFKF